MTNQGNNQLAERLRAVHRRGQMLQFASGVLALCRWGLPLFVAGVALDWVTHMPAPGRIVILAVVLGVPIFKAWRAGWRHMRPFNATRTALQIEERLGRTDSLLITAVQLSAATAGAGTANSMIELTCNRAEEEVRGLYPSKVISFDDLKRPLAYLLSLAVVVGALAGIGVGLFGTNGSAEFASVAAQRLLPPWKSKKPRQPPVM